MDQYENVCPGTVSVDIGDLRVDYLLTYTSWNPKEITRSQVHLHSKHEIQFVFSGEMLVQIDEKYALKVPAQSVLLIPPNTLHSHEETPGQRLTFILAFQSIRSEQTARAFSEFQYYCELFASIRKPLVLKNEVIITAMNQLSLLSELPCDYHKRDNLLTYFFIQVAAEAERACGTAEERKLLQLGNQYNYEYLLIDNHISRTYKEKSSSEELAKKLHISRRQLDRIIEKIWGKTYASLILERRMLIAQKLLSKTDLRCEEIAQRVGYASYPGFYLAFKKHFGMAPEKMRLLMTDYEYP